MARSLPKKMADSSQRNRFIATARALGADEDEAAFKEKLAAIARQKSAALPNSNKVVAQKRQKASKNRASERRDH
jgi:hypothetical protein